MGKKIQKNHKKGGGAPGPSSQNINAHFDKIDTSSG